MSEAGSTKLQSKGGQQEYIVTWMCTNLAFNSAHLICDTSIALIEPTCAMLNNPNFYTKHSRSPQSKVILVAAFMSAGSL